MSFLELQWITATPDIIGNVYCGIISIDFEIKQSVEFFMWPFIHSFKRFSLLFIIGFVLSASSLSAQQVVFAEDFEYESKDEFLENSGWSGDLDDFILVQESGNTLLRLNNQSPESNNSSQISTISTTAYGEWEFFYWFESFAATDANRAFIFLLSDIENLTGNVNGYALRTGENGSDKRFRLIRFTNGAASVIATSETQILQDRAYQIRVTRSETDGWRLYVSEGYGSTPMLDEEFASMDNTHQSSSFFGIRLHYSSTRNQQFYFDDIIISRELENLIVEKIDLINANQLEVTFSQSLAKNTINPDKFRVNRGVGSPQTAILTGDTDNIVELYFANPFDDGEYLITINDVEGEFGQQIDDNTEVSFSVLNPFFVEAFDVQSRTEIEIIFSQDIQPGGNISEKVVLNGSTKAHTATLSSNNVVLLQFENLLDEGEYTLTINNLESIENWKIEPGTVIHFSLQNTFDVTTVSLAAPNILEVIFTDPPDEYELAADNFALNGNGNPGTINYDPSATPETVTLEFDKSFFSGEYSLTIINVKSDFGWPLSGDTEFGFNVENPFVVTGFETDGRTGFMITFSQDVDTFSAADFQIEGAGQPDNAALEENDRIILTYENPVPLGNQKIIINNVSSSEGWEIEPETTIDFSLFDEYEEGDLVISEFYYRVPVSWRTDEFQRPQYVEIYNRTNKLLNMRNFTINGNNISIDRDLPIAGREYLVITRGVPVFEQRFGERNFVEADQFPQLNLTSSSSIIFKTGEGHLIEELTYTAGTWGGNEVSLERYSFDAPAGFRDNWAESVDVLTGSPGLPNTVAAPADPPVAVSASFPEPRTLHITFSRTLTGQSLQNLSNFSLNNNTVFNLAAFTDDERTIEFKTEENLEDQFTYTFSYQDIGDIFGNTVSGTQQFEFIFDNPFRILSAWLENETSLRVQFTLPTNTSAVNLSDFQVSDGTLPVSLAIPNSETIELNFSSPFDTGAYEIVVNNLESFNPDISEQWELEANSSAKFFRFDDYLQGDIVLNEFMYRPPAGYPRYVELHNVSNRFLNLRDWELRRAEGASNNGGVISTFDMPVEPGGFVVLTPNAELLEEIFGPGPWVQMVNYPGFTQTTPDRIRLIDSEGGLAEFVDYTPSSWGGNGVALERRSVDAPANEINNWGRSEAELLGTPGAPNSIGPDQEGPRLVGADFIDGETVLVTFSGSLDFEAISESNFGINRSRSVTEVAFISNTEVVITLDAEMGSGSSYTVTVTNIRDIFGNTLSSAQASFIYYRIEEAQPGDVVINEFMYNEPDDYTRYIELYNASNRAVDLAGWQQANDTGTRRTITNTRTILAPDSYIVILPNLNLLSIFPDIPYINAGSSLSALKNGGDNIVIANAEGVVIDSLRYSPDWGGNGVALERRRADRLSLYPENWAESPGEMLGTPGTANQVDRDFNLAATSVRALNRREVRVQFNSAIDENDAVSGNFSVGSANPANVSMEGVNGVLLQFDSSLPTGRRTLTINNVQTPGGFRIAGNSQFSFTVFDEFAEGDVVINEFMYRPPAGYPRYIELFNNSGKLLNLRDWRLQRRQISTENRRIITSEDLLFHPGDYLVLTDNAAVMTDIFGNRNYVELSNYPNFTVSTADQIRLFTDRDVLADSLEYSPSVWGGNGVALERLSPVVSATLQQNWSESPNILLGTPGMPNEAAADTIPPRLLSASQFKDQGFILRFDKKLDRDSSVNLSNYSINPLLVLTKAILNHDEVILYSGTELINGLNYEIAVRGLSDIFGNVMEPVSVMVQYLEFGEAAPQQIVINEILYRRLQSGSPEFVEIYNRTDQNFDLSGWKLSDAAGSATIPPGTAIRENDYLVFTDSPVFAAESEKIIHLPGFRPLNNTGDAVVLRKDSDVPIDSVYYRASWYQNPAGISLERKDPAALSIDPANWAASSDERGSTPAEPNSRFEIDATPPEILFANLASADSVVVIFSEFVDLTASNQKKLQKVATGPSEGFNNQTFSTRFFINRSEVSILMYDPQAANRVVLDGSSVYMGEELILAAENLTDFQGNITLEANQFVAQPLSPGDLVINEIMFNPIADNRDGLPDQSEYIEIYNRRPYAISLEGIFLHDEPDEKGEITRIDAVSTLGKWIPAGGYAIFYPEPLDVPFVQSRTAVFFDLTDELKNFAFRANRTTLSLPNAGRQVYLADSTLITIDMVDYNPNWHNPNIVDTRGIALERINPDLDSNDPSNWGSSANVRGGTPGSKNSIYQDSRVQASKAGVFLHPNPFSPDGSGFEDTLFINYIFDEPDYLLRIRIYDRYGRLVRNLAEGKNAGFEGTVLWDGRTDRGGKNRIGIYIILVEAYNSTNGRNLIFKETAVIARQF